MLKKIIIANKIVADGNMYCAYFEDFKNYQESVVGFGENPMIALSNLLVAALVEKSDGNE